MGPKVENQHAYCNDFILRIFFSNLQKKKLEEEYFVTNESIKKDSL
jgi:hypothetical protein